MEDFEYLYIMDFSDTTISEIQLGEEDKEIETSDLLSKYGFDENTCSWMFTTTKINNITKIETK